MIWQRARLLVDTAAIGTRGTELWVLGPPATMPQRLQSVDRMCALGPQPGERIIRTHLHLCGAPAYCRLEILELLPDFRAQVDAVEVTELPGFDLAQLWVGSAHGPHGPLPP